MNIEVVADLFILGVCGYVMGYYMGQQYRKLQEYTGMYNVDFISIVMGYIVGVGLCYTTMQMIYALEDADDDT